MKRLVALLWLAATALAHPHSAPAVWADVEVEDAEVRLVLTVRREVLAVWLGMEVPLEELEPDRLDEIQAALTMLFRTKNPVHIDGERRMPVGTELALPDDLADAATAIEFLRATLVYRCDTPPRRATFLWETFEEAEWQGRKEVPFLVKYAREVDVHAFSEEEPEYSWHARETVRRGPPPRAEEAPPGTRIPVPSVALGLAGRVLLAVRRRTAGVLSLLAAVCLVGVGHYEWRRPVPVPAEAQAARIFRTLQNNVYRAFDARSEDEIYDLLAVSVDGSILDDLYGDIYESLILREQGGAVCTVEKVEPVETHVNLPPERGDEPPRFFVDWHWRVHCAVTHWGHTHRRLNEYEARYTVRHDGRSWKIAAVDVKEHKRIDIDTEGEVIPPDER